MAAGLLIATLLLPPVLKVEPTLSAQADDAICNSVKVAFAKSRHLKIMGVGAPAWCDIGVWDDAFLVVGVHGNVDCDACSSLMGHVAVRRSDYRIYEFDIAMAEVGKLLDTGPTKAKRAK